MGSLKDLPSPGLAVSPDSVVRSHPKGGRSVGCDLIHPSLLKHAVTYFGTASRLLYDLFVVYGWASNP